MKQLITLLMTSGLSFKIGQCVGMIPGTIEEPHAGQVTAPKPAGPAGAADKPAPGERAAATTSAPEQRMLHAQAQNALDHLRRMQQEKNAYAPDRR